jgi:hypothetical protein
MKMNCTLLTSEEACEFLKCEKDTLKSLREHWIEGVHYFKRGKGLTAPILFNRELILDWLANQSSPQAHQVAMENFRRSLPSGQKRNRKAS